MPLIVETLFLCGLAYGVGFGLMAALLKRRRRVSFLDRE